MQQKMDVMMKEIEALRLQQKQQQERKQKQEKESQQERQRVQAIFRSPEYKDNAAVQKHLTEFGCKKKNGQTTYFPVKKATSYSCLLYTSPSPRDGLLSRMPSSA